MVKDVIQVSLQKAIHSLWPDLMSLDVALEKPIHEHLGDYAVNVAFRIAQTVGQDVNDVLGVLKERLEAALPEEIQKIEIQKGYLNFFLTPQAVQNALVSMFHDQNFGYSDTGKGRKVIIEYPSTNVAKVMHYGNSRSAFIGDALARIYQATGYDVVRWDYIGDWGTSFGKIIKGYKLWGDEKLVLAKPIETLLALYVRFNAEAKTNKELEDEARNEFKKLELGDDENRKLWEWFRTVSLGESQKVYDRLGLLHFDVTIGESFYEKDIASLIDELLSIGIAQRSEGAVIINLDQFGLPPALIQKSDGASLYITRDIANVRYRLTTYQPAKILHIVGNEQALHFQQLRAIMKLLGLDDAIVEHVKFGLILGDNHKKLATREGNAVSLESVVDEAYARAHTIVHVKNPDLDEEQKKDIARVVAIGALKYDDLKEYRTSDIVFDWQKILDFHGNSGPYIQYTYARLANIVRKAPDHDVAAADFTFLGEPEALTLIKYMLEFPDILLRVVNTNAPNHLALFLYELANRANVFYESVRILPDEIEGRLFARLILVHMVMRTLSLGLQLLGIEVLSVI